MKDVFIYDAIRTARTKAKTSGGLHNLTPQELLRQLYHHLETRVGLDPNLVDEVILGCVTQHGEQAANIARTSVLYAGWPDTLPGLTVNRFCSSSVDAISIGALKIAAGQAQAVVAGGVEMMSRVPLLSDQARIFTDPQFAAQCHMLLMGSGADLIATRCGATRTQIDAVALQSQQRAYRAQQEGRFTSLVSISNEERDESIMHDECIRPELTMEDLDALPAAFAGIGAAGADKLQLQAYDELEQIEHLHTAGNSPAMCDGAATVLLGNAELGTALGLTPRARLVAAKTACAEPLEVLSGCITATQALLSEQKLTQSDVDLFELHEAFAATIIKAEQTLGISSDRLNVNGGVIALGHPMGATGAMMTGSLLDELERSSLTRGLIAASGAGGSGSALLLERC
ncbi:MAG: acetyl-CoA C-acyltransferase [Halioglobus sp.]